jgi:hypothetical protein
MFSACALGLIIATFLTIPLFRTEKHHSQTLASFALDNEKIQDLDYLDLNLGSYLFILMGTDCQHCQEAVPRLNMLTENLSMTTVVALCPNAKNERMDFVNAWAKSAKRYSGSFWTTAPPPDYFLSAMVLLKEFGMKRFPTGRKSAQNFLN